MTLLQFAENLSDRRAADAVRGRIDWKYLLGLELTDPGFDPSVRSEFCWRCPAGRSRLVSGGAQEQRLDTLLARCREQKRRTARGQQRTDATHVLGAVHALNRFECALETLRAALKALAATAPEGLRRQADAAWVERSVPPADEDHVPQGEAARRASAEPVGRDGPRLLAAVMAPDAPAWLRAVPAVERRRVWGQTFCLTPAAAPRHGTDAADRGEPLVRWRTRAEGTRAEGFPPSLLRVAAPYDPDVHYAKKRTTEWIGDKGHLTETCDDERPHRITHVATTPAPVVDRAALDAALDSVHRALAAKELLPDRHVVDAGSVDADQLVTSHRDDGVTLFGPAPKDQHWQATADEGFTVRDFTLDGERKVATGPAGHTSRSGTPDHTPGPTVVTSRFATTACRPCPLKARGTRSARRLLTPRRREEHEALEAARAREAEEAFATEDHRRAGIEGTLSAGGRCRRACAPSTFAAPAPSALPRRTSSTCSRRQR